VGRLRLGRPRSRKVRLRDAPVAADLVAQVESLGDSIVGFVCCPADSCAARASQSGDSIPPSIEQGLKRELSFKLSRLVDLRRPAMLAHLRQQDVDMPITSAGSSGFTAVATASIGGLSHATMIGQQGLGATLRKRTQLSCVVSAS
jgi:hypothetical protein